MIITNKQNVLIINHKYYKYNLQTYYQNIDSENNDRN